MLMIGATLMMNAQTVVTNESLTHDGNLVTVTFDVDTDVKGLPSNRKEVLLPYIYNGKDTLYFDPVEISTLDSLNLISSSSCPKSQNFFASAKVYPGILLAGI